MNDFQPIKIVCFFFGIYLLWVSTIARAKANEIIESDETTPQESIMETCSQENDISSCQLALKKLSEQLIIKDQEIRRLKLLKANTDYLTTTVLDTSQLIPNSTSAAISSDRQQVNASEETPENEWQNVTPPLHTENANLTQDITSIVSTILCSLGPVVTAIEHFRNLVYHINSYKTLRYYDYVWPITDLTGNTLLAINIIAETGSFLTALPVGVVILAETIIIGVLVAGKLKLRHVLASDTLLSNSLSSSED